MAKISHDEIGEGNLHELDDDTYFEALATCPPILDAEGRPLVGIFDDVQDKRAEKAGSS